MTETQPKQSATELEIRKAWRKEIQDEMLWWIGIHLLRSERAKYSWEIRDGTFARACKEALQQ